MSSYDLIVIGGGSAGVNTVHRAAGAGWKVALIESNHLGGTCINVGCIPSKTLIHSSRVLQQVRDAGRYGVLAQLPQADWSVMIKRKNALVKRIRARSYNSVEHNENITFYEGEAYFSGLREITVNGEIITAEKVVIAAGARPSVPPITGLDQVDYLTSTTAMEIDQLPKSLLIIGGGIIALEFSQLFSRLGVKVTILQRNKRLAPILEEEISVEIGELLKEAGIKIITGSRIGMVGVDNHLCHALDEREGKSVSYSAEKILVAAGRTPNSDRLQLEVAGVDTDEVGFIKIDSSFKTSAEGIWAIGDITGGPMFTHKAWHDGMLLSRFLIQGQEISNRGRLIPFAVFTEPEIAGVGLGERQAYEAGLKIKIQRFPFARLGRALAVGKTDGFVKLLIDKADSRILGAHIIGPEAGELLHELIAAIRFGATTDDLQDMMHIHPTLSEAIHNAAWAQ